MARFDHLRWVGCLLGVVLLTGGTSAQPELALSSLTVLPASLPEGCALAPIEPPRAPVVGAGVVHVSSTLALSLPSNPWSGSDADRMELIWPAVLKPESVKLRPLPDGFPRDRHETLAWRTVAWEARQKQTEGLTEAYRARYVTPFGSSATVSAVRFTDARRAAESAAVPIVEPRTPARFVRGPIMASVSGTPESACFEAVRTHVQRILR